MTFRDVGFKEWSAGIMLVGCILAGLFYFGLLYFHYEATGSWMMPVIPLFVVTVVLVIISMIGHIIAAVSNPDAALEPDDERDKAIRFKAGHFSGLILGLGVIISLLLNAVSPNGNLLFHMIFGSLLTAQIAEYTLHIISYRRTYGAGDIA